MVFARQYKDKPHTSIEFDSIDCIAFCASKFLAVIVGCVAVIGTFMCSLMFDYFTAASYYSHLIPIKPLYLCNEGVIYVFARAEILHAWHGALPNVLQPSYAVPSTPRDNNIFTALIVTESDLSYSLRCTTAA